VFIKRRNTGAFLLFVDLHKPYDSVARVTLLCALKNVTEYRKISHFVFHEINRTEHFAMLP